MGLKYSYGYKGFSLKIKLKVYAKLLLKLKNVHSFLNGSKNNKYVHKNNNRVSK